MAKRDQNQKGETDMMDESMEVQKLRQLIADNPDSGIYKSALEFALAEDSKHRQQMAFDEFEKAAIGHVPTLLAGRQEMFLKIGNKADGEGTLTPYIEVVENLGPSKAGKSVGNSSYSVELTIDGKTEFFTSVSACAKKLGIDSRSNASVLLSKIAGLGYNVAQNGKHVTVTNIN